MPQCHIVPVQTVFDETEEVNQRLSIIHEWEQITLNHFEPYVEDSDRAVQQYFVAKEILHQQESQVYKDWHQKHLGQECVLITRIDTVGKSHCPRKTAPRINFDCRQISGTF